jgi:hypothetical protein
MLARKLEIGVLATTFVLLVLDASGGAGWAATSTRAVVAARMDHSASAPLYDLVAGVAALLPVGEPAFRLGVLGALLGALTLAGVVAALRALVPEEPAAGLIGAIVVMLAPPFRELLATPNALAACGTVWVLAFVLAELRRAGRLGAGDADHRAPESRAAKAQHRGDADDRAAEGQHGGDAATRAPEPRAAGAALADAGGPKPRAAKAQHRGAADARAPEPRAAAAALADDRAPGSRAAAGALADDRAPSSRAAAAAARTDDRAPSSRAAAAAARTDDRAPSSRAAAAAIADAGAPKPRAAEAQNRGDADTRAPEPRAAGAALADAGGPKPRAARAQHRGDADTRAPEPRAAAAALADDRAAEAQHRGDADDRAPHSRSAAAALAATALVIGSAPWLGLALAILVGVLVRRHARIVVVAAGAIGVAIVVWWFDARGELPGVRFDLAAAVAASGHGAGAIVIGAGLLGLGIAAATALPRARILASVAAIVAVHEVVIGGAPAALLAVFGVAAAIVPAALAKLVASELTGVKRAAAVVACGIPLVLASFGTGAALVTDDGTTPRRLVADLIDELPAGPGTFIATRPPAYFALVYERAIAGARPDLELVPPLPAQRADVIAADALRAGRVVAADAAAFGRLDLQRTRPRGRGFQLLGEIPTGPLAPVEPPAHYATAIGADEGLVLSIERAQLEAATGHLDRAARAAGLVRDGSSLAESGHATGDRIAAGAAAAAGATAAAGAPQSVRFGAADLALLAATQPTRARPSLFGFLPLTANARGPWLADAFGDDLAWMAAIHQPALPLTAPMPRKLHALWRQIFEGTLQPGAPEIAALGPAAVAATTEMWKELAPAK